MEPISVVIPTFNRASLIGETLKSVVAQSLKPCDIVVIDDGSTDDTAAVVAEFGSAVAYRRIPNSGVQAARNLGISLARGEWIALCDSDDLWLPNHLACQARLHRAAPELEFTFADFLTLRDGELETESKFRHAPEGYWTSVVERELPEGYVFHDKFVGATFQFFPIFPSALMFKKSLFERVGGFDVSWRGNLPEDGIFTTRCLFEARAGAVNEPTAIIRKHGANATANQVRLTADEVTNLLDALHNEPRAAPYREIIEREVVKRSIDVANGAFAANDYALMLRFLKHVPLGKRSAKLHMKRLIAGLPSWWRVPLNAAIQRRRAG